jgi:hypothetical protein
MENPARRPISRISRVKKPVHGLFIRLTIFSMSVVFPHPGVPVKRMFLRFTLLNLQAYF